MIQIKRTAINAYRFTDLPGFQNGLKHSDHFSMYRGVIVCWDEDLDARVLDLIDSMDGDDRDELFAIHEHAGSVSFKWKSTIPHNYYAIDGVDAPDGDWWSVYDSSVIGSDCEKESSKTSLDTATAAS